MVTPKESVGHGRPAVKPDRVPKHKGGDRQKAAGKTHFRLLCRSARSRDQGAKRSGPEFPESLAGQTGAPDAEIDFQRDFSGIRSGLGRSQVAERPSR